MSVRPIHHRDRVVARSIEEQSKTAGGILIPDTAQKKSVQCEVFYADPWNCDENVVAATAKKAGDRVRLDKGSGMTESDFLDLIDCNASVRAAV